MSQQKKPSKKVKKDSKEDFLSSSGVSTLSGGLGNEIRKVYIYKNGDPFHKGVKFVINTRTLKDIDHFLNQINDKIELSHGVKKLYTTEGKRVTAVQEIENGKNYVAVSSHFKNLKYGEFKEKVWKPPSRRGSPIFRDDRIRTARTRSQEPRARRDDSQNRMVRNERSSSVKQPRQSRPREPVTSLKNHLIKREQVKPKAQVVKPVAKPKPSERLKTPQKRASQANGTRPKTKEMKIQIPPPQVPSTAVEPPSPVTMPVIRNGNAEIIEFPDEKVTNVQAIHKSPSPSPPGSPEKPEPEVNGHEEKESASHSEASENESEEEAEHSEENDEESETESESEDEQETEESEEEEEKSEKPNSRKASKA